MDSPVSAFATYKAVNKSTKNRVNKRKNKNKITHSRSKVKFNKARSEDVIKIAQQVKQKQNKDKGVKNIAKKKLKNNSAEHHLNKPNGDISLRNKTSRNEIVIQNDKVSNQIKIKPTNCSKISNANQVSVKTDTDEVHSLCSNSSFDFVPVQTDSREEGLKVFKWLIAPHSPDVFLNEIWEKKPLHISRKKPAYYKEIITTPIIDNMLRNENIQFTKNIDITSYVNGKRETHNPEGRAHPRLVWDFYLQGCSIRLLNPQTYIPKLHLLNATLQEFFNSFVGANAYLTPPDSQGFAPHYDDIEAFIIQIEGKKLWRIYKPVNSYEILPRVSSKNFSQDEIGEPILEIVVEAGDLLYFPRGYIHQGVTIDGEHSLHLTISMYQKHSWADLFEKLIPGALHLAIRENVELRHGLPFDIYDNFGIVNSDVNTPRRMEITKKIHLLFSKIINHLPIDDAVDQMSKNYQQDALPPVLTDLEKAVTVFGDSDVMIENGKVINRVELGLDTKIRLLRKNILRMVSEDDNIRLYYYLENSLEYHGNEMSFLEIEEDLAPAIETLITTYPEYVAIENLDISDDSNKLHVADILWGRGLIMTEYPLESIESD